jgi:hypothetical protein
MPRHRGKKKKAQGLKSNLGKHEAKRVEQKRWKNISPYRTTGGPSKSGLDSMTTKQKIKTLLKRFTLKH